MSAHSASLLVPSPERTVPRWSCPMSSSMRPSRDRSRSYVDLKFSEFRADMHAEMNRVLRWVLGLFVPVWAATAGTLIVALSKL